jgi:hypothetical protein
LTDNSPQQGLASEDIDTGRPHPARIYDYLLGGYDNYEVDREAAGKLLAALPEARELARMNRDFMRRAVRHAAERGIRQFVDIGTGIPTSPNTHEVAHSVAPGARVVYVDNDPIVSAHAGARLSGSGQDATGFILADARDPKSVLDHPVLGELIDFDQPVAVMFIAMLHFIGDHEDPYGMVGAFTGRLAPGSVLILSHGTKDFEEYVRPGADRAYSNATARTNARTGAEIRRFFDGFELVEPGLVAAPLWRPDPGPGAAPAADLARLPLYGAVGVKN